MKKIFYIIICVMIISGNAIADTMNPINFGILNCKTGIERFYALSRCHTEALQKGSTVSYQGIDSLYIEIPNDGCTIPLTCNTDFCNVRICVMNNVKDMSLFTLSKEMEYITIEPSKLRKGAIINQLTNNELCLISITDSNPWIKERLGFGHAVYRSDILVIKKGVVTNDPIVSYNTASSQPSTSFIACTTNRKDIRNIKFIRHGNSTYKTYLFRVEDSYNVNIHNVVVHTPVNQSLIGDALISVANSAKVNLSNIKIDSTYSKTDTYGYGICINNVYDLTVNKLVGHPQWGIFYASNLQCAHLEDCDINRFDTHCYGKDYVVRDCNFKGLANPFSSVYGKVSFSRCTFDDTDPVSLRQDYNANTPFDLSFDSCVFNMTEKHNCILRMNGMSAIENERLELKGKNLPNLSIRNCKINFASDVKRWFLVITGKNSYSKPIKHLTEIDVNGLTLEKDLNFDVSSSVIQTYDSLHVKFKNVVVPNSQGRKKMQVDKASLGSKTIMYVDGLKVESGSISLLVSALMHFLMQVCYYIKEIVS